VLRYRFPVSGSSSPVVLVHGAWHGAWCWERVLEGLAARQVPTIAVDLPGHGDDRGPMGDLHTDTGRVREVVGQLDHPVVLVGHSYGGAVITEAGNHPAVGHLVYLCAMALDEGESCMIAADDPPVAVESEDNGRPDLSTGMVVSDDGLTISIEPAVAAAVLFNQCDADTTAWAVERLGPQPLTTLQQPAGAASWRSKPSTYVVCADDRIVHPELQRVMAKRCGGRIAEWDSDHSPFLSHPDRVIDLLAQLAG
jgi:pimeloyl-ACP methyl ester carboxylesterase